MMLVSDEGPKKGDWVEWMPHNIVTFVVDANNASAELPGVSGRVPLHNLRHIATALWAETQYGVRRVYDHLPTIVAQVGR